MLYILPNLCTTASLFCGFMGIVNAIAENFENAALMILLPCFFDILDGRIARLTDTCSDFGAQYDSLVDIVALGVTPGILVYSLTADAYGWNTVIASFLFWTCSALRLARFNVQLNQVKATKSFVGLPMTTSAATIAMVVLFYSHSRTLINLDIQKGIIVFTTCAISILMVSSIPYNSPKPQRSQIYHEKEVPSRALDSVYCCGRE
jgi:CDP-diacylglycerol--serine O-phosphatidyltransferase